MGIEQAVADAFSRPSHPAAIEATRLSVEQLQTIMTRLCLNGVGVERARYEAERAERRYRAWSPKPAGRRGLETEWEKRLRDLAAAEMELRRREQQRPNALGPSNSNEFRCWAPIFGKSGRRRPRPIAIARNCCARY